MTDETDDPMDRIRAIADRRRQRIDQHDQLREDPQFKAAMGRIDRLIMDYGLGLTVIDLMATRWPEFFEQLITLRVKQQFVESMVAAGQSIKEGLHNPARRELRFLLEASIKTLWLDTGSPAINGVAPLAAVPGTVDEKVAALDDLGKERLGEVIDSLTFRLMDAAGAETYRQTANSLYGRLSTHVHISSTVIGKDLKGFDKDRDFGFETVGDVNAMADLMRQVLDLALASHFEAFDAGLVGDMFVALFDDMDRWSFRKTPLVSAVSRQFDDKAEGKP